MFVTNWISTTKIQKISEITNFFRHYFLSRTEVTIINRRLSNSELCEVISKCSLVVCPYLTMSQSGIPQTVFTFGKPIVASDLFGFQEIISNGENGLLFKCGDSSSLARCINDFISNDELRKKIYHNVRRFEFLHKDYSWDEIADFYVNNFIK